MDTFHLALIYAAIAGVTIPLGGFAARIERIRPYWLEQEFRHSVIAFGGGVLIAAIALVLVPEGIRHLDPLVACICFAIGGLAFMAIDRALTQSGTPVAQLMAMLLDFIPEAAALGAFLATGEPAGLLLALLISLQNFPEGFNAYRELIAIRRLTPVRILILFALFVPLGPLAAAAGHAFLSGQPAILGMVMLTSAGGILYLTFNDIAPQAKVERHWAPPLGAVAGFALGLLGHLLTM